MRKTILLVTIVAAVFSPLKIYATVVFNDGQCHDIDYAISDNVDIWGSTTVRLVKGGSIGPYRVHVYERGGMAISEGTVKGYVGVLNYGWVQMSGGVIERHLLGWGSSHVTVTGGLISSLGEGGLEVSDQSQLFFYGGQVGDNSGPGADDIRVEDFAKAIISGGRTEGLSLFDKADVSMVGGRVGVVWWDNNVMVFNEARLTIKGGRIINSIYLGNHPTWKESAIVIVEGTDFKIDYKPADYGVYVNKNEHYQYGQYYTDYYLTGTLSNGDKINNVFYLYDDSILVLVAPPIYADADGPYVIYAGDTLTLDASGSTDANEDIVSYKWDLDDNNSFETDAGGQAVFDVNYTYLQSLGFLVNHTHNIHLQVTDSEGQSDIADSTLTIFPKPVFIDIKPQACPNPLNVRSGGVLPVAVLGSENFDVNTIQVASIRLSGVAPIRNGYEDVATPMSDGNECECTTGGPDGYTDLTLRFKTQEIVEVLGELNDGDVLVLSLTGVLIDEIPIEGADCVLISGRHKPFNQADINKDGVVDNIDFAVIAENWLQSSILDD